jgi:hypothetical protein
MPWNIIQLANILHSTVVLACQATYTIINYYLLKFSKNSDVIWYHFYIC